MTQEQFKKAVSDRESHIKNLQKEISELRQTYLDEHSKFKIGEKVIVIEKTWNGIEKEHTAFITKMWTVTGEIGYSFNKAKKDGTISSVRLYTYGKIEIKKPNSEPNVQVSDTTEAK